MTLEARARAIVNAIPADCLEDYEPKAIAIVVQALKQTYAEGWVCGRQETLDEIHDKGWEAFLRESP